MTAERERRAGALLVGILLAIPTLGCAGLEGDEDEGCQGACDSADAVCEADCDGDGVCSAECERDRELCLDDCEPP